MEAGREQAHEIVDGPWLRRLCDLAQQFVEENGGLTYTETDKKSGRVLGVYRIPMDGYVDLIFAFGLAQAGEYAASRELLDRAHQVMAKVEGYGKPVHDFLLRAFTYRIRQALEGKPHGGPFPADLVKEMEDIAKTDNKDRINRYVIDRMRKQSRILEPEQEVDPYKRWTARMSDLDCALAELAEMDQEQVAEQVQKLLHDIGRGEKAAREQAQILCKALNQSLRINEDFARTLLEGVAGAYDALPVSVDEDNFNQQAALLESAFVVAAHFRCGGHVHPLVDRFARMLRTRRGVNAVKAVNAIAGKALRSLRKLGMREEVARLLNETADLISGAQGLKALDPVKLDNPVETLQALLHVAGGWYFFGRGREAERVVQAARALLYEPEVESKLRLNAKHKAPLACTYAVAVSQAPVTLARQWLEEVFGKLRGLKDTFVTSPYYSRFQQEVVEAVVLAVVEASADQNMPFIVTGGECR